MPELIWNSNNPFLILIQHFGNNSFVVKNSIFFDTRCRMKWNKKREKYNTGCNNDRIEN